MPTRNTVVLERIVKALGSLAPQYALSRLETEFENSLLIVVGYTNDVARHTEILHLAITELERGEVLDFVGRTSRKSTSIA